MHQVLVYSDSLSWGIVPTTRKRLPFDARWPGVMETALIERRLSVRVIEDCLNGCRSAGTDRTGNAGTSHLADRSAADREPARSACRQVHRRCRQVGGAGRRL